MSDPYRQQYLVTQCITWENKKNKWVRVNHKSLGSIYLQVTYTNCDPDPNKSYVSGNFIRPGSSVIEFSDDFSPLDLDAPVDYYGPIPPPSQHTDTDGPYWCQWYPSHPLCHRGWLNGAGGGSGTPIVPDPHGPNFPNPYTQPYAQPYVPYLQPYIGQPGR
ncbi:hypothetical protein [Metabacillus fastidiosus]|uniref:hypothetical protein n=1 Tax=Metabacillus fastidiosus TaxID=1458 RepID=UPI000826CC4F|nr:hypothetical protein [Metabacillus fastidiosus]MED4462668.1 hypothetical protein [Metabacillus fastidiosus]